MNKNLLNKVEAIMSDVGNYVEGKAELIYYIMVAMLTRQNVFILGEPGNAKSMVIDLLRERITGGCHFKTLMTKQKDEEQLFARIDLNSYIPGSISETVLKKYPAMVNLRNSITSMVNMIAKGSIDTSVDLSRLNSVTAQFESMKKAISIIEGQVPEMITKSKIPEAHFVYIDETFKANDGVLNAMLQAMNEKEYTNEGVTIKIPVHCFFGSSNEIPDFNNPEEKILAPFFDRFQIRLVSTYLNDRSQGLAACKKVRNNKINPPANKATMTLAELEEAQKDVSNIEVPDAIDELMWEVKTALQKKDIKVSDRRFLNYYPLAQAQAWLSGRDKVEPADLMVLKNYLWNKPQEIETVMQVLEQFTKNPVGEKIAERLSIAKESFNETMSFDYVNSAPTQKAKQFMKFKKEFVKVYDMLMALEASAPTDKEKAEIRKAITGELEGMSKKAHDKYGFTYTTLDEIKMLMLS